jgi:hypothetical protein
MPPKEAPPKPKAPPPQELCGCGVNTYRAPPKGKKRTAVEILHVPGCTFQRTTCPNYPHLPKCTACETGCPICLRSNLFCPHCSQNKCAFMFQRDVMGWALPRPLGMPMVVVETVPVAPPPKKK